MSARAALHQKTPAYSKFSNHATVVMDPYTQVRNLTSRCSKAKFQRIQGRLRQIVRSLDEDAQQFWSCQKDMWPHVEMPEDSDLALPNALRRARSTPTMPSGHATLNAQPLAGPASGGPPQQKQPRLLPPMPQPTSRMREPGGNLSKPPQWAKALTKSALAWRKSRLLVGLP